MDVSLSVITYALYI